MLSSLGETESGSAGTQPNKGYPSRRCVQGTRPASQPAAGRFISALEHRSHASKNPGGWGKAPATVSTPTNSAEEPDFLLPESPTLPVNIRAGRATIQDDDLFAREDSVSLRFGRDTVLNVDSVEHRNLVLLLAENRVRGTVRIPLANDECQRVTTSIRDYLNDLLPKLRASAAEITENADLQARIVGEALKRLLPT